MPSERMRSVSSATWMNSVGRDRAELGVVEAGERLDAEDAARAHDRDDRLVVHVDLVVLERGAQPELELAAALGLHAQVVVEDLDLRCHRAPWPGASRRARRAVALRRRRRRPAANAMPMLAWSAGWRPLDRRMGSAITRSSSAARWATGSMPADVVAHDDELVAGDAADAVHRAGRALQPLGDLRQHLVAARVPEGVVDELEPVEVDEQHRGVRLRAATARRARAAGCRRTPCGCTGR